jgi:hypothetical protein
MLFSEVQRRLWNFSEIISEIEAFPQTYKTILKEHYQNSTLQSIFKRKMRSYIASGRIMKCLIPQTRFSLVVFFSYPKRYYFVFAGDRLTINTYCTFDLKHNEGYLVCSSCYVLKEFGWVECDKRTFTNSEIIKVI